jgi:DNA-binding IclR family transcriptional regulator
MSGAASDHGRAGKGHKGVRVLARGLAILKAFEPDNDWRTNTELSVRAALPKPTVSRITANLMLAGYLDYEAGRAAYRLSTSVLALGFVAASNRDLVVLARPAMQAFADRHRISVVLAAVDDDAMVCHEVAHSHSMLFALRVRVGSRLPLGPSALGQALVGAMGDAERTRFLSRLARTEQLRFSEIRGHFESAIMQMKEHRYCVAEGTLEPGTNGVAVVLDTPDRPHAYALGCAAPSNTLLRSRIKEEIAPGLLRIKNELEAELNSSATLPA